MSRRPDRVGVRELRQHLSVHLRRVAGGETLEVTEHGRPVAVLAPLSRPDSVVGRLVAAGRATEPEGDLVDLGPPKGRTSRRLSDALHALRDDRR
jgi:prevent-host-death family protein